MLTSQPYGSSSLTQSKIPLYIPCHDPNRNNAPIYEVYPRYIFFFLKNLHSILGSVIRFIECNQKNRQEGYNS